MVRLSRFTTIVVMLGGLLPTACNSSSTSNAVAPTPARCALSLSGAPPVVESLGGSGTVTLSINRECEWSAKSEVDWIAVSPASGQGEARVSFNVASNPQPLERKGAIAINDQKLEVTQRAACAFALSPQQAAVGAGSARVPVTIATATGCAWHAVSQAPWITIASGASGAGPGVVEIDVRANTGDARTGDIQIAGIKFSVSQSAVASPEPPAPPPPPPPPNCQFSLSASNAAVGAAGGTGAVDVEGASGCAWTARSSATWLVITAGASGTGDGEVGFSASANPASTQRTATLTIAGLAFTVTQAGAIIAPTCTYSLSSTSESVPADGGTGSITVSAPGACDWTAQSSASWLTVTAGASGSGNGTVQYSAAAHTDTTPRSASLTIAGQTVTVSQAAAPPPPCTFSVSPTTVAAPAGGLTGSITITASASSCPWTASSSPSFVTLTGSTTGTGDGSVAFAIEENTSTTPRTGTISVSGEDVDVNQEGAAPPPPETVTGAVSSLDGTCPTLTFVVSGRTVHTTSATDFQGGSCNALADGNDVTVEGVEETDNSITATVVRRN